MFNGDKIMIIKLRRYNEIGELLIEIEPLDCRDK